MKEELKGRDFEMPSIPTWEEQKEPVYRQVAICPICGAEAEDFYVNEKIGIVGCDLCTRKVDAWGDED